MPKQERDEVVKRHGDLEIEESLPAQERLWRVQKVGRTLAVLVLVAALAGALGRGPLSRGTTTSGPLAVEYERVAYRDSPESWDLTFDRATAGADSVRIWVDGDTLARVRLQEVVPQPRATELAPGRTFFEFDLADEPGELAVRFAFQPERAGVHTARLGVERGPSVEIDQVVLP